MPARPLLSDILHNVCTRDARDASPRLFLYTLLLSTCSSRPGFGLQYHRLSPCRVTMTLYLLSRGGNHVQIFLVLAFFLVAPAACIAVKPSLVVRLTQDSILATRPSHLLSDLFPRHHDGDEKCPIPGQRSCGEASPSDFCCPSSHDCMVLAANTTALCCPRGDCQYIKPIVCNLAFQNVTRYPGAAIKTVALDKKLGRCGGACCPFGYICKGDSRCVRDEDQEDSYAFLIPQSPTTVSVTITPDPTSASPSTVLSIETSGVPDAIISEYPPSASATETTIPAKDDQEKEEGGGGISPTGVVTAGTVAGVCAVAGIGIFIWMRFFRKKHPPATPLTPHTPYSKYRQESWGYFSSPASTPMRTRYLHLARGPDDKFVITPSTARFSPPPPPPPPPPPINTEQKNQSPVELPATPVSMCMWMNLEDAAVEEPRLAYVLPPKQSTQR